MRRKIEKALKKAGFEKTFGGNHDLWKHPDGRFWAMPNKLKNGSEKRLKIYLSQLKRLEILV